VNTFGDGFGEADGWWDGGRSIEIESQGLSFDRAEKHRKRTSSLLWDKSESFMLPSWRDAATPFALVCKETQIFIPPHGGSIYSKMISDQFPKAGILSISISRRGEKLDVELVATQPRVLRYMEVQI
jgi:hypothetical protein